MKVGVDLAVNARTLTFQGLAAAKEHVVFEPLDSALNEVDPLDGAKPRLVGIQRMIPENQWRGNSLS